MSQHDWLARRTREIAREVRRYRKARGMSVQQLSDALEHLGVTLQRPVLSNLENGRRETISAAELNALAKALQVSRLLLEFPLGRTDVIEVLPGVKVTPWEALQWALGNQPLPGRPETKVDPTGTFELWQDHTKHVTLWRRSVENAKKFRAEADRAESPDARERLISDAQYAELFEDGAISSLRQTRKQMRAAGLTPPELPLALQRADDEVAP
jgi:transcriptional regulator with XRE-family HTH domain